MIRVALFNEVNEEHLEKVKNEMAVLGAPTIKVIAYDIRDFECDYIALEGSHRTQAAIDLEIDDEINFEVVGYINELYGEGYKLSDFVEPDGDDYSIDHIVDANYEAPVVEVYQELD